MKVLNFGSMNYDYVYQVDHMMMPGETQMSTNMETFCGGKGLNQSTALAKAGVPVFHAGAVGEEGDGLLHLCKENKVDISYVEVLPGKSGHTIIQVDKNAQNSIMLFGGANRAQTKEHIDKVLSNFGKGDIILLQNEINYLDYVIESAYNKEMTIILNPSPFDANLDACDMNKISIFLMNEIEGYQLTGSQDENVILEQMKEKFPKAKVVLTLGKDGAVYQDEKEKVKQPIFPVKAVDTTAAGDTFTGYFIAGLLREMPIADTLRMAAKASSIAVSRKGAAPSIPSLAEVEAALA